MVLYDYSKEFALNSIIYITISVICIICLAILTTFAIRIYMKRGWSEHSVILSIAVAVSLIISVFLSNQAIALTKYNVLCTQGNYETAFGTLDNLLVFRNDYRDEELYTIEFTVNDIEFKNLVNSFSIEQCNQFTSFNGNVEVRYSYIKGEIAVYQIVTNTLD